MRIVQDKTISGEIVSLDDTRFIRCKFEHCTITWSGRKAAFDVVEFSPDTRFEFTGTAGRVIGLLNMLGMIKPVYTVNSPDIN